MQAASPGEQTILGVYEEVCSSYHAVDDFRMKLLGILPASSLVGIFGLGTQTIFADPKFQELSSRLVGFVGLFAAIFTLSLFVWEIRGILRCSSLIRRGEELERQLGVQGQFYVCLDEHACKKSGVWIERLRGAFDAKAAACVIYSSVASAWVFTSMHFGMGWTLQHCAVIAGGLGVAMGVAVYLLVLKLIAA